MGWWFWLPHPLTLTIGIVLVWVILEVVVGLVMLPASGIFERPFAYIGDWLAERDLEKFIAPMRKAIVGCPECRHLHREHFIYQEGCMAYRCLCTRSQGWLEQRGFLQ